MEDMTKSCKLRNLCKTTRRAAVNPSVSKKKAVFFRRSSASSVYVDQDGRFFGVKQLKATYRCAPTGARVYQGRVYTPKAHYHEILIPRWRRTMMTSWGHALEKFCLFLKSDCIHKRFTITVFQFQLWWHWNVFCILRSAVKRGYGLMAAFYNKLSCRATKQYLTHGRKFNK